MSEYDTIEVEDTDLEPRTERALTECMTVLSLGGNIYSVTTQSGSEYRVDTDEVRCTCPDHKHRGVRCKHQRRVAFAVGDQAIPATIEDIDEHLGKHVEPPIRVTASDGGKAVSDTRGGSETDYTYHIEPLEQGSKRYVRCEGCGREVIPPDPELLAHPVDCPNHD